MFPRLCRYEVRLSSHPTVWLTRNRLTPSAREPLHCSEGSVAGVAPAMSDTTACWDDVTSAATEYSCSFFPTPSQFLQSWRSLPSSSGVVTSIFQRRITAATSAASGVRHIVVCVSCSSCGKPISCLDPVSGHGELLARVCLRESHGCF